MLEAVYGVTPSIKGLNPDHDLKTLRETERTWIAKRSRPEVPEEEQERRRQLGKWLGARRRKLTSENSDGVPNCLPSEDGLPEKVSEAMPEGEVQETPISAPVCAGNAVPEPCAVFGLKTPVGEEVEE